MEPLVLPHCRKLPIVYTILPSGFIYAMTADRSSVCNPPVWWPPFCTVKLRLCTEMKYQNFYSEYMLQLTHPHFFGPRGLISSTRQFGTGSIYHSHLYAIVVGRFIPIPVYLLQLYYPNHGFATSARLSSSLVCQLSHLPPKSTIVPGSLSRSSFNIWLGRGILLGGANLIMCWVQRWIAGLLLRLWLFFLHFRWVVYFLFFFFLTGFEWPCFLLFFGLFQFPKGGFKLNWWGNVVFKSSKLLVFSSF